MTPSERGFTERLGGEWREAAPTYAQVDAHNGFWWLAGTCSPVTESLRPGDDLDGRGAFVAVGATCERVSAERRDIGAGEDWRGAALVCLCDSRGVPAAWPSGG